MMQRLARVTIGDKGSIDVFWEDSLHRVIYVYDTIWISRNDSNIMDGVRSILNHDLTISQIMVFDQKEFHGKVYDHLDTDIYDCSWSDFACDKLVLHFKLDKII
jgi:hypothetical protein